MELPLLLPSSNGGVGLNPKPHWSPRQCPVKARTVEAPTLLVMGVTVPRSATSEVLPSGVFWTASSAPPRPGEVLWDDTLVSSMAGGRRLTLVRRSLPLQAVENSLMRSRESGYRVEG